LDSDAFKRVIIERWQVSGREDKTDCIFCKLCRTCAGCWRRICSLETTSMR